MQSKLFSIVSTIVVFLFIISSCAMYETSSTNENAAEDNSLLSSIITKQDNKIFDCKEKSLKNIEKFLYSLEKEKVRRISNLVSKDFTLSVTGREGTVPFAGTYYGKKALEQYLDNFLSSLKIKNIDLQYNIIDNDNINTHLNLVAKVLSTGKSFDLEYIFQWQLDKNGLIKYLKLYYDTYAFYKAYQNGGETYISDIKGTNDFQLINVNFDSEEMAKTLYQKFFTEGDLPGVINMLDTNVLWVMKGDPTIISYANAYSEVDGFMQFVYNLLGTCTMAAMPEFFYYVKQDNKVDVHLIEQWICNSTGKLMKFEIIHSFSFTADGKIKEFKSYNDTYEGYYGFTQ
ncbi:MAG: hypothetical protein A2086_15415 [Spirochaetes bacterium GWD1_27_9]|nr:MAG: hypothetical protein A2Z98_17885 [Spirochaetes bacterium GWB1_27_13]OHD21593.1 MAG: hypothetical protein A2Y34_13930 [Spirochaetes bacterium GWC1_27_15]OHD42771.1 MAG: hypothetical protein A2086_15415 [Spirochaetes bacterium GWD1_27_9]